MAGKKKDQDVAAAETGKNENEFTKEQLAVSERFRERRDILAALLDDGKLYTVKAVEEKIENYMKGKVR
ncbi:MAG: hypothetical protein K2I96_04215 [Lachnospiraceae bacterium]|nr:hypothetical protein [Lachnospiraceae bacterium]